MTEPDLSFYGQYGEAASPIPDHAYLWEIVAEKLGAVVSIVPISSEGLPIYQVELADGHKIALKLYDSRDYRRANFQARLLEHLGKEGLPFAVPQHVAVKAGAPLITDSRAPGRLIEFTSWLEGPQVVATAMTPQLFYHMGKALATLHLRLSDLRDLAVPAPTMFDPDRSLAYASLAEACKDDNERRLVIKSLERAVISVGQLGVPGPTQPIHGDFSLQNVLAKCDNHQRIGGVFDFGDATVAARIHDLGIACALPACVSDDTLAGPACLVAGYASCIPLSREEVDVLPSLMRLRLCTLLLVNRHLVLQRPLASASILKNIPRVLIGLTATDSLTDETIRQTFLKARFDNRN